MQKSDNRLILAKIYNNPHKYNLWGQLWIFDYYLVEMCVFFYFERFFLKRMLKTLPQKYLQSVLNGCSR